MNSERIISLVTAKAGSPSVRFEHHQLQDLAASMAHADIRDYLTCCLPVDGYAASGVRIHSLDRIRDEVCAGAGPGGYIFPHGYVVIASSVGGNAVCFHSPSGHVVWADHESFSDDSISYEDRTTGDWRYLPFAAENIQRAVVPLSDDIESFLTDLLHDRLETKLDELD
jgi:hypothetical protein